MSVPVVMNSMSSDPTRMAKPSRFWVLKTASVPRQAFRKSGLLQKSEMLRRDGAVACGGSVRAATPEVAAATAIATDAATPDCACRLRQLMVLHVNLQLKNFIEDMQSGLKHRKVLSYNAR